MPLINADDKEALFAIIRDGVIPASEPYVAGKLRMVLRLFDHFSCSAVNVDGMFQIGYIGLFDSISYFDSTLGVKCSTVAVPPIVGGRRGLFRETNRIRAYRSMTDTAYQAISARDTLSRKVLKVPTMEEIALEVGTSSEDRFYVVDVILNPMSPYEAVCTGGGDAPYGMDQISDERK